jgi:hypothetical protein
MLLALGSVRPSYSPLYPMRFGLVLWLLHLLSGLEFDLVDDSLASLNKAYLFDLLTVAL